MCSLLILLVYKKHSNKMPVVLFNHYLHSIVPCQENTKRSQVSQGFFSFIVCNLGFFFFFA